MKFLIRGAWVALIALATMGGAQAEGLALVKVGSLPAATRPAGVPLDYVVTPNGYFHPSCVAKLEDEEQVLADGSVEARDGSRREVARCLHADFAVHAQRTAAIRQPAGSFSGWLAYSDTDPSVSPPAKSMVADWTVPVAPTNVAGQTLYFFPGLESVPNTLSILQPVLGWNGYENSAWTMANWNCCIRGTVYTGNPINVNVGDQIHGEMVGAKCTANKPCTAWKIVSTDVSTSTSTTMSTKSYGQIFNWYFGGVMEVYGVASCNQLPASGSVTFTNVSVDNTRGKPVAPNWITQFDSTAPACGYVVDATTRQTVISFNPGL